MHSSRKSRARVARKLLRGRAFVLSVNATLNSPCSPCCPRPLRCASIRRYYPPAPYIRRNDPAGMGAGGFRKKCPPMQAPSISTMAARTLPASRAAAHGISWSLARHRGLRFPFARLPVGCHLGRGGFPLAACSFRRFEALAKRVHDMHDFARRILRLASFSHGPGHLFRCN